MQVAKVLTNNVVVALDGRDTVILTGRGIGYSTKPGQTIDLQRVSGVFRTSGQEERARLVAQLIDIAPEYLAIARGLVDRANARLPGTVSDQAIVPIADHLSFAVKRSRTGMVLSSPLVLEVPALFPNEHAVALELVRELNRDLGVTLPDGEAVALALHLVNSTLNGPSSAQAIVESMEQLFTVMDAQFGVRFDRTSAAAARFVTHMRFFFIRVSRGTARGQGLPALVDLMNAQHPDAWACAAKIANLLEIRLKTTIVPEEVAYVALHVARLQGDLEGVDAPTNQDHHPGPQ